MGQKFNITAQLQLLPPKNLQAVANQIHSKLNTAGGSYGSPAASKNLAVAKAQMADLAKASNATAKAVSAASSSMADFGRQTQISGKRLASFIVAGSALLTVVNAFKSGIGEGIKFQSELVKISQITGKSTKQLQGLSDQIHGLGKGLGSSSRGLLDASNTLSQAGLSARETEIALKALAKTDLAPTFKNIRDTTEGAIAIFGQFGTSAADLERQLGSINSVSARYAVESSDLVTAIRKSGGAFRSAGGSLKELLGLFTSVRSSSRESADTIAAAFRTIFARLQRSGTQRRLKDLLGVDLAENGRFVGPMKAIERLHHALKDLPQGSTLFAKAGEEIGGIRQLSKVIPLITNYGKAVDAVRVAQEGELSLNKDVISAQESLAVQISRTRESWQAFFDELVNDRGFKGTISSLLSLARGLATVADSLRPLIPALSILGGIKLAGLALPGIGRKITGHAAGGYISSGKGSVDDVPAMLMRGEYVLNSNAVRRIGRKNLDAANFGNAKHFRKGGSVGEGYPLVPSGFQKLGDIIRDETQATQALLADRKQQRASGGYGVRPVGYDPRSFEASVLEGLPAARPISVHSQLEYDHGTQSQGKGYRSYREGVAGHLSREQIIRDLGKGGLLDRIGKQNRARSFSANFAFPTFSRYGKAIGESGIAQRIGGLGSSVAGRLGRLGLNGQHAMLAAGVAALNPGTEKLISGIAGDRTAKAFTGGASAALVGGAVAGPYGALVAGALGAGKALEEFQRNLLSDKIEKGFSRIEMASSELADSLEKAGGRLTPEVLQRANALDVSRLANRNNIERFKGEGGSTFSESYGQTASGLVGGFANLFDPTLGTIGQRFSKGYNAPRLAAEKAHRENVTGKELGQLERSAGADSQLRTALLGQSKRVGDYGRSFRGQDIQQNQARQAVLSKELTGEYKHTDRTKNLAIETALIQKRDAAEEKANLSIRHNTAAIDSFTRGVSRSTTAVENISNRLADLKVASESFDNRTALLGSITGNTPATLSGSATSAVLGRLGSAGFERAARTSELRNANRAHNALGEALPGLLGGNADIGTQAGFTQFKAGIGQALAKHGVSGNVQGNLFRQLDELQNDPQFASTFGSGTKNNELKDKLLAWSKDLQRAEVEAAQGIESHGKELSEKFAMLAQLGNERLANLNATDNARLAGQQFVDERRQAHGLPSQLGTIHQQLPFLLNQERLTGLKGEASINPHAILASIASNRQNLLAAETRRQANPADTNAVAAVRGFENQLQRSVQALRHLADASNLNASLQNRLAALDNEKKARLGLGEQFFGSSADERRRFGENATLAQQAIQAGTLDRFSVEQQQRIVGHLQQTRDVKLGEKTGGQHLEALVNNSGLIPARPLTRREQALQARQNRLVNSAAFQRLPADERKRRLDRIGFTPPPMIAPFRQTAKDQAETGFLEQSIANNHKRAVGANRAIGAVQDANQADLANGIRQSSEELRQAMSAMSTNVDKFAKAAATIPHEITLKGKHEFNVNHNGAELLAKLRPELLKATEEAMVAVVKSQLKKNFPELGTVS